MRTLSIRKLKGRNYGINVDHFYLIVQRNVNDQPFRFG